MKSTMGKSLAFVACCLLLLCGPVPRLLACGGGGGGCPGGCPSCETCQGSTCVCTSDCCQDSDCGPPACWDCDYCDCVCVAEIDYVTANRELACVGCDIIFTAVMKEGSCASCVTWTAPGGDPGSGTGCVFTTHWDTPGDKTVTASTCKNNKIKYPTIIAVSKIWVGANAVWYDVTGSTIVVLKGTKYTFKASRTPPGSGWPAGSPVWSGCASGTGPTIEVTFDSIGTKTLTAKCQEGIGGCGSDAGKNVTIEVILPEVYRVGFGDYSIYETPAADDGWADGTTVITDPVYDSDASKNDPACVEKNADWVYLHKVKLKVSEPLSYGTMIRVDAGGTEEWNESNDFALSGTTSTDTSLEITGNIINQVKKYDGNFQIDWKYKVPSGTNTYYDINTTNHTVYVVYDDAVPLGVDRTVKRIDWLCEKADGKSTRKDVADAIHANLTLPFGHDESKQSDDWDLMCSPCDEEGECDEHARFMVRCLDLIGVSDSLWYNTYASYDTEVYEADCNVIDANTYWLKFDANGDGTVDNNFEGCVDVPTNDELTTFHYYTVTPKLNDTTDCLLWREIGPDNKDWKQKWIYSPDGEWLSAWPPQPTLPGNESYDSCP